MRETVFSAAHKTGIPVPKAKPAGKQLLVESINLAKVAAGGRSETRKLIRGIKFLLEPFPPEEQVPSEGFMAGAMQDTERTLGGNQHNRYCFSVARKGRELAGASSVIYLDEPATVLIGYVRATAGMGGAGMKILGGKMLEFGQAAARETGKTLQFICGEVERPEVTNTVEAQARLRLFHSMGAGVLGLGTSFEYYEPQENGGLLPLSIAVLPLKNQTQMRPAAVRTLVRSIYAAIYDHIPKGVYEDALGKILGSIPKEPLRIAR
jgi:hypothetical protein